MVKDVINECLILLDDFELKTKLDGVQNLNNLNGEISEFSEKEKQEIVLLVSSLKNVINSVTRSYLKNYTIERIKSDNDAKISYSEFSKPVISIKSITDEINGQIIFKPYFDHVKVPYSNMNFDVCYAFETKDFKSLFDELEVPLGLTNYCLALGVVSAYLEIKLLYSEAELFESKFKAELEDIKPNSGTRSFFVWRN